MADRLTSLNLHNRLKVGYYGYLPITCKIGKCSIYHRIIQNDLHAKSMIGILILALPMSILSTGIPTQILVNILRKTFDNHFIFNYMYIVYLNHFDVKIIKIWWNHRKIRCGGWKKMKTLHNTQHLNQQFKCWLLSALFDLIKPFNQLCEWFHIYIVHNKQWIKKDSEDGVQ
jgi:hypothetical protein